jgi:hypothetical protein
LLTVPELSLAVALKTVLGPAFAGGLERPTVGFASSVQLTETLCAPSIVMSQVLPAAESQPLQCGP